MSMRSFLLVTTLMACWPGSARAQNAPVSSPVQMPSESVASESVANESAANTSAANESATGDAVSGNTTVTVTGQKKVVKKTIDKTVYSTANNPKADNGTAEDVLRSTPSLSVSAEGALSVKGNANVTVLIDGKPSALMSGENRAVALQTMAGSDIASVEIITNPSAAYNANGGAIINIVLKKDRKAGAHGALRGNVSDQGLWNLTLAGDYSKTKLSLHGSIGFKRDGNLKYRQSDVVWHDPVSTLYGSTLQSSKIFVRRIVQTASAGLDYDLNDTDGLSAQASYNFRRSRPYLDERVEDFTANTLLDDYHRISHGPNQQTDNALGASYNHLGQDTVFKAGFQHSDTFTLTDKSFENRYTTPSQLPDFKRVLNKSGHHLDQITIDYTNRAGSGRQLGAGLDIQRDATRLNTYFAALDPLSGAETPDFSTSHRYLVVETLSAAYVTALMTWADRWQVLAGLRYETLSTELRLESQTSIHGAAYESLNPSLHLKYTRDAQQSLTLSYRQSLQRPDPHDLNPYLTYGDAKNLYTGNPNLRPQGLKSLEISYDREDKDLSRSLGAFYRKSSDTVVDFRTLIGGNIVLTSQENAGNGDSFGITSSVNWKPIETVRVTVDGGLYHVALETIDLTGPEKQSDVSGYANLGIDYTIGADDFAFDAHASGPGLTPQGKQSASSSLNVTWKRRLSKTLTLSLSASDLLDGSKQTYSTTTSTFAQRGYNHFVARRIYIGFVYKLGSAD